MLLKLQQTDIQEFDIPDIFYWSVVNKHNDELTVYKFIMRDHGCGRVHMLTDSRLFLDGRSYMEYRNSSCDLRMEKINFNYFLSHQEEIKRQWEEFKNRFIEQLNLDKI